MFWFIEMHKYSPWHQQRMTPPTPFLMVPLCRLIVLALRHFEGTLDMDQLISSYLLCKSRWSIRKHIKEMSMPKVSPDNIIKVTTLGQSHTCWLSTRRVNVPLCFQTFIMKGIVQPLPLACSRVQPGDQRPPVDRVTANVPKWLKASLTKILPTFTH